MALNECTADRLKVLYLGTPKMSATLLEGLLELGYDVIGVVTQEDAPVGRKKILTPSPVKEVALRHNLPVYTPARMKEEYPLFKDLDIDLILTFAYGQIVPGPFLDYAKIGAYNFHGSILPRYRGAAPIQRALMAGEGKTGVSLMKMVEKMDAGKVYAIEEIKILEDDDYGTICEKMALASIKLAAGPLLEVASGTLGGKPQDESLVTIAKKIKKEDEALPIDRLNGLEAFNYVRALSPTPGAYVPFEGGNLKIFKSKPSTASLPLGSLKYQNGRLFLGLREGSLELLEVQPSGSKKMAASAFVNGHRALFL